jgi:hypothetical protein
MGKYNSYTAEFKAKVSCSLNKMDTVLRKGNFPSMKHKYDTGVSKKKRCAKGNEVLEHSLAPKPENY